MPLPARHLARLWPEGGRDDIAQSNRQSTPKRVPPDGGAEAMGRLALRHNPHQGGTEAQMTRISAAYVQARTAPRRPV